MDDSQEEQQQLPDTLTVAALPFTDRASITDLLALFVGPRPVHYLAHYHQLQVCRGGMVVAWNWAAFWAGPAVAMARGSFLLAGLYLLAPLFFSTIFSGIIGFGWIMAMLLWSVSFDHFYLIGGLKKVMLAELTIRNREELLRQVTNMGGFSARLLVLGLVLEVLALGVVLYGNAQLMSP